MRKRVVKLQFDEEIIEQTEMYSKEVKMYLRRNSELFLTGFSNLCEQTSGRISYEKMLELLGRDYPKANWIEKNNYKEQIVQFFKEVGIPFRADDSHLYFP